eukprot:1314748-Lingulodinium_polyedra.AAC.1
MGLRAMRRRLHHAAGSAGPRNSQPRLQEGGSLVGQKHDAPGVRHRVPQPAPAQRPLGRDRQAVPPHVPGGPLLEPP